MTRKASLWRGRVLFAYQNLHVFLTSAYDADFRVLRCRHVKPVTSSSEKCSTHGVSGNVSANMRLFYTVTDGQYKMTTRRSDSHNRSYWCELYNVPCETFSLFQRCRVQVKGSCVAVNLLLYLFRDFLKLSEKWSVLARLLVIGILMCFL